MKKSSNKKRFAFIDFQNTDSTTKNLLGFSIDWKRLCDFLKNNWHCEKVFLYIGVDQKDLETVKMLEELESSGFIVRQKALFSYKNKDRTLHISCPKCKNEFVEKISMGHNKKANCDVDLTVDAMDLAEQDKEFYIFTGDGDFEFLIKNIILKGVRVCVVSSAKKINVGFRYFTSRLSTKLRRLFSENSNDVYFIEINNLKMKIKKD